MLSNAFKRNVVIHDVRIGPSNHQKKTLKIFFISDIHRRKIDRKLIRKIDQDIDLIIIGGDLAEKGVPLSRIASNIKSLSNLGKVYYVWGNNDREAGERHIRRMMKRFHVTILENDNFPIPGHSSWGICGTDDPTSENVNLEKTLCDIEKYKHILLVCHQPIMLREVEAFIQPTIMLAGHTHGGQIRVGKFGLFQKGSFQVNTRQAKLISNGYGTSTIPLRLGAPSECHIITVNY